MYGLVSSTVEWIFGYLILRGSGDEEKLNVEILCAKENEKCCLEMLSLEVDRIEGRPLQRKFVEGLTDIEGPVRYGSEQW